VSSPLGATQIWKATLADVNGDGKADRLLVGTHDNVHVQLSQGDGQFTTLAVYPIGCGPWEVHVVDLNGDQLPDMVTSFGDHLVCDVGFTTYLGDGLGHFVFKYKATAEVIADMTALAPVDFDLDGDLDLAGSSSSGSLVRFAGFGDGFFGGRSRWGSDRLQTSPISTRMAGPTWSACCRPGSKRTSERVKAPSRR
jgi:hypothetical protein